MKNLLHKFKLPAVVFITGACVLIIEVTATRVLSPYFGNTIFTVSSVISVVLAALSLGYYFGGKLCDKFPEEIYFFGIILASGLLTGLLYYLSLTILPILGYKLSIINGPVISAFVLFFLPSLFLGTLSPFAIKLEEKNYPGKGIGTVSGTMFFWSTLGSIFGSLLTGFVLIPTFGVSEIILSVALLLVFLGSLPLIMNKNKKLSFFISLILLLILLLFKLIIPTQKNELIIFQQDGVYEKLTIVDDAKDGKKIRLFFQDRSNSGARFLDSEEMVYDYTKYYSLYKLSSSSPRTALVIGGGAYTIPRALITDLPEIKVDVSEIEPSLFYLAQKYFGLKPEGRINNFTTDGRRLLKDSQKSYDYIYSDVYYSLFSIPTHFTTIEFFKLAKSKMTEDGIFIANLIGSLDRTKPSFIMSEIKTLKKVFPNSYFFAVNDPADTASQNIIFLGINGVKKLDFNSLLISGSSDQIIKNLGNKKIDLKRYELLPYPALTDNYAPVDFMVAETIRRETGEKDVHQNMELYAKIQQILRYGPRFASAPGHKKVQDFIIAEMNALTDKTQTQIFKTPGKSNTSTILTNIIARNEPNKNDRLILATHYDSKKYAFNDKFNKNSPVPGANDSASGVAVLTEIAKIIKNKSIKPNIGIDFVFFDGEEGDEETDVNFTDWKPLGSSFFADHLKDLYPKILPKGAIVIDMVCDKNLNIKIEPNSKKYAENFLNNFWETASIKHPTIYLKTEGPAINDDHTPLNNKNIPSILLIDFDYEFYHTTGDTADKCSGESLGAVTDSIIDFVYKY